MEQETGKPELKKSGRNMIITIVAAIIVSAIVIYFMMNKTDDQSLHEQLVQKAQEICLGCPRMADEITRLDSVTVSPGNDFKFNLTMMTIEKKNIDTATLKMKILLNAVNFMNTDSNMEVIRKNNTRLIYYYLDKNGAYAFSFSIRPNEYEE